MRLRVRAQLERAVNEQVLHSRAAQRVAWLAWLAMFAWPTVRILRGKLHSVAFSVYMTAGLNWWFHGSLYDLRGIDGFQYFPHAAWVFAPFWWIGSPLRDLLWRGGEWALYGVSIWQLSRQLRLRGVFAPFVLVSALAFGPAVNALFSGQVNLALAGLLLLACAALMQQRWLLASVLLVLGAALKPLLLVPLVLLAAVYPALRVRALVGLALITLLPFLTRSTEYVAAQYAECILKLRLSADPDRQFEDIRGLLSSLHVALAPALLTTLRVAAGVAVLALCMQARKTLEDPALRVCALSANYLVLFNPRSQPNSYVMVGAFAGCYALQALRARRWLSGALCMALVVVWTLNPHFTSWGKLWVRPLASVVFFSLLASGSCAAQAYRSSIVAGPPCVRCKSP